MRLAVINAPAAQCHDHVLYQLGGLDLGADVPNFCADDFDTFVAYCKIFKKQMAGFEKVEHFMQDVSRKVDSNTSMLSTMSGDIKSF